jgi:hypothetical protein
MVRKLSDESRSISDNPSVIRIWSISKHDPTKKSVTPPKTNRMSKISKAEVKKLLIGTQNIEKPSMIDPKFVKKFRYDKF